MNSAETTSHPSKLSTPSWFYAFIPHKLGSSLTSALLPLFRSGGGRLHG